MLLPGDVYRGARTKYASAEAVAVLPIMPSRFQPKPNWARSTSVFADTRTEPSSSTVTCTGSGSGR